MKPLLIFHRGLWWCAPEDMRGRDYFLWACCAPTVREVCDLWRRCL